MGIRNIVWTADRVKCLVLVGVVVMAAACGKSNPTTGLAPSPNPKLPDSYSLSGLVLAGSSAEEALPVEGARVAISRGDDSFEAITNADGWYEFDGLSLGTWHIIVEKDGYAPAEAEVDLSDSASVDFMLEPMAQ